MKREDVKSFSLVRKAWLELSQKQHTLPDNVRVPIAD